MMDKEALQATISAAEAKSKDLRDQRAEKQAVADGIRAKLIEAQREVAAINAQIVEAEGPEARTARNELSRIDRADRPRSGRFAERQMGRPQGRRPAR